MSLTGVSWNQNKLITEAKLLVLLLFGKYRSSRNEVICSSGFSITLGPDSFKEKKDAILRRAGNYFLHNQNEREQLVPFTMRNFLHPVWHRLVQVRRELKDHSVRAPCHGQGHASSLLLLPHPTSCSASSRADHAPV